jgi:hypothetical protein
MGSRALRGVASLQVEMILSVSESEKSFSEMCRGDNLALLGAILMEGAMDVEAGSRKMEFEMGPGKV